MVNEVKSKSERKPQVPSAAGIWPHTCFNCKYEKLSVNTAQRVNCMKKHVPGDRFPLREPEE